MRAKKNRHDRDTNRSIGVPPVLFLSRPLSIALVSNAGNRVAPWTSVGKLKGAPFATLAIGVTELDAYRFTPRRSAKTIATGSPIVGSGVAVTCAVKEPLLS